VSTIREHLSQVLALDQLHHQRGPFEAIDLRDVGMIQRGERLGFTPEPGEPIGI
jgi:hypothetical protein